ncbi:HpcH/HpaI aldolase/citrate lyase family protein [Ramlibacter sp.]|uniref:HpcH/HpaI aldolase/citrate lyase family protein n=1 Tax=Ramlibacter sp. TaxID=1917967 RepID=UPI003D0E5E68
MTSPLIRARSFLFVPGDRPERLGKALASAAHAVIVDLEDAVAPEHKSSARVEVAGAFGALAPELRARTLVRINSAGTPWHDDDLALLRELGAQGLGAAMLPKSENAADIGRSAEAANTAIVPLVETALGLHSIDAIARAPRVLRLAFGNLDFQADTGIQSGDEERELDPVRLAFTLASRLANLPPPIDGVTGALDDETRLTADARRSRRFGFGAKLCIHPKQAGPVNEALGPTAAEREWARRVVEASAAAGSGAFRLDGKMVDAPVLLRAKRLLDD